MRSWQHAALAPQHAYDAVLGRNAPRRSPLAGASSVDARIPLREAVLSVNRCTLSSDLGGRTCPGGPLETEQVRCQLQFSRYVESLLLTRRGGSRPPRHCSATQSHVLSDHRCHLWGANGQPGHFMHNCADFTVYATFPDPDMNGVMTAAKMLVLDCWTASSACTPARLYTPGPCISAWPAHGQCRYLMAMALFLHIRHRRGT